MSYDTKSIQFDAYGRPIPQYFNRINDQYEVAEGSYGSLNVNTMQRKWRHDFPGTSIDTTAWNLVQTGSGHTVSVANSVLSIATGTSINTETILRSINTFTIPFRVWFIFYLSQRIANQEIYLEIVNAAGDCFAQWLFDGATATSAKINAGNKGTSGTAASNTINTTASYSITEIELFPDEAYFHSRTIDSTATRGYSFVRTRLIPDPEEAYYIQIRLKNLSSAPASTTTLFLDAVVLQDITELTAEITGGRGQSVGSQSIAVQTVGGTISTVSNVAAATISAISNTIYADSTTNLSSSATFTGTGRDSGTALSYQRFRVLIAHTAGNTPGHLVIEQSTDNTTFRETHRIPIPSDGQYRIYEFPVLLRYIRAKFINGATAQTLMYLASALVHFDGNFDFDKSTTLLESTAVLAGAATYTGNVLNLGPNHSVNFIRNFICSDQAGTLYVEQSRDGTNWRVVNTQAVAAGSAYVVETKVATQYIRVRYVNGATLQGLFELITTLVRQ